MNWEPDSQGWPRCMHLAGADGTGKSTQARALLGLLETGGISARYVWLRFPHLFCAPFLAYARLRGYSQQEVVDGYTHGYWHFDGSWLMTKIFPWALLLDTFLTAMVKVHWPLSRGSTLVCDRFVVDILADLMAGLGDHRFDERIPGRLFFDLLPRGTQVVVIDLDTDIARQRCPELVGDRSHSKRRDIYLDLAARHALPVISNRASVEATTIQLVEILNGAE